MHQFIASMGSYPHRNITRILVLFGAKRRKCKIRWRANGEKKGLLHKLSTVCAYMMVLTGYILFDTSTETISKMEYRMIVIDAKETSSKKRTHIVTQCIIWECAHFYNGRWPALKKKKNMENTKRTKKKWRKMEIINYSK